ncbi:MAG: hypothetical protein K0U37_05325 [Gammaproteobacteria bacterium]|nr:hypothetical protein [Gammaproteobacteria bacterium]
MSICEVISQMSPEKINQMTRCLVWETGGRLMSELQQLYQRHEPEYEVFQVFLATHSFRYLGGNNSKNFAIESTISEDEAVFVLKVENRLGRSNEIETRLRDSSVSDIFMPIFAERETAYTDRKGNAYNLLVTEYCDGSDVGSHGHSITDDTERCLSAVMIYSKMADFLGKMQNEFVAFPDMKNANWLIDIEGNLRVSDTKSFVEMSARQKVWFRHGLNEGTKLMSTTYMSPPEFKYGNTRAFSGDKMHAYLLGKNLYQYLTGSTPRIFYGKDAQGKQKIKTDASELDFSHAVFSTDDGVVLKALIEASVKNNPDERISLTDMHVQLEAISLQQTAVQKTQEFREMVSEGRNSDGELEADDEFKLT